MFRIILLACLGLSLAACATTATPGGAGIGSSATDLSPGGRPDLPTEAAYGYALGGDHGWTGRMSYVQDGGEPVVQTRITLAGGEESVASLAIVMPYLEGGVRRFSGETRDGRPIDVVLQAGPCEASGERHVYFAMVELGSRQLNGCGDEIAVDDRWSNYLMDYLPAIDACLGEFRNQQAHVSVAYTMAGGHTGVRIVDGEMRTWECATRDAGGAVNSLRPVDAVDALAGEGDPIFIRSALPEFGEGCYVYESVREADGTLIGAFGYDACDTGPVAASREPGVG